MALVKSIGTTVAIIALFVLFACIFTVHEGERALLLRLGKLTTDSDDKVVVYQPGIHFKYPIINNVRHYDIRLRTMAVNQSRVLTEGQKYVIVDYYVKWRIKDLGRYFQRVGGYPQRAEALLEKRLNNAMRSAIGQVSLIELISGQRATVMKNLRAEADSTSEDIGIEVLDVRIKRADLPQEVALSVFDRMRTKRKESATKYRSEGRAKSTEIRAQADADVQVAVANANRDAAGIRAAGQQKAAKIYADAFKKDSEFYAFHRSLEAYKETFQNHSDLLVLQPDGDFFKYFNHATAINGGKRKKANG